MNHNIWVDAIHVLARPGKAVMMLIKELDKSKAEVEPELGTNLGFVVWKIWMNRDIVQLIYARLIWISVFNQGDCNCYMVEGLALKVLR